MLKRLKDRTFNVSLSVRNIVMFSLGFVLLVCTVISSVYSSSRTITITDGENPGKIVTTSKRKVIDVLSENGFVLNEGDKLSVETDVNLRDGMNIKISRAMKVSVIAKGEKKDYMTTERQVGKILCELGFDAKDTDKINPGFYEKVYAGSEISYIKTTVKDITVIEEIPYESVEKINTSFKKGTQKVLSEGSVGEKEVVYRITYEDGVETGRETITENITKEAVKRVTEVAPRVKMDYYQIASAGSVQTSRSGDISYSKILSLSATAYDASSCGKVPGQRGYGITATGAYAQKGIVAVDPSVIPLGTKLYIESADGRYVYGYAIAADTGGAIKGNRIDLCFDTNREALNFGRRAVKAYVLN